MDTHLTQSDRLTNFKFTFRKFKTQLAIFPFVHSSPGRGRVILEGFLVNSRMIRNTVGIVKDSQRSCSPASIGGGVWRAPLWPSTSPWSAPGSAASWWSQTSWRSWGWPCGRSWSPGYPAHTPWSSRCSGPGWPLGLGTGRRLSSYICELSKICIILNQLSVQTLIYPITILLHLSSMTA